MKKQWLNPELKNLTLGNTETVADPLWVNPNYDGKVKCGICGEIFENGSMYNAHLTKPVGTLGMECPQAPDDADVQEWAIPLS